MIKIKNTIIMDNNEKAEEICRDYNYTQFLNDGTHDTYTESAVLYMLNEMAEWKEQQMIDKAVEWLNDWLTDDSCQCGIPITKTERENFLNDFKQSIIEE